MCLYFSQLSHCHNKYAFVPSSNYSVKVDPVGAQDSGVWEQTQEADDNKILNSWFSFALAEKLNFFFLIESNQPYRKLLGWPRNFNRKLSRLIFN